MKSFFNLVSIVLISIPTLLYAQHEGFIYGKVYTIDNKVYEGPIRWGKEEVYWVDIFNAGKEENKNLHYLTARQREELFERQNSVNSWGESFVARVISWNNSDSRYYQARFDHQFACQFGEIKKIIPVGKKYVELEMQNGNTITLKGEGYNDVGLEIRVMDDELGETEIAWNQIEKVEFMKTPKKLNNPFGAPLYGVVEAYGEIFTGYIQWDHDERLSTDKLDGNSEDGKHSIAFGKIASIERVGGRSRVTLKSNRELLMSGSNDVDNSNRGIIVMNNDWTAVDIPWSEFTKVTFKEAPGAPDFTYESFATQKELNGSVVTHDGNTLTGKIVFDLDEAYTYELLQGTRGDVQYMAAFRQIKSVAPVSRHRANIELRSGKKITLEDSQDVSERNHGVLVFTKNNNDPVYLVWDSVKSIEFK